MKEVTDFLSGKKTHLAVVVVIGYVLIGKIGGYYEPDSTIVTALGAAALSFLRIGVAKAEEYSKHP